MADSRSRRVVSAEQSDELIIQPIGAGQEVGRSCILLQYKGRNILLDCGVHPGYVGERSLPFFDAIRCNLEEVELVLISHFHLDHCGALPWFLLKTPFKGRCFMTHPTKAIYKWLLNDYTRVGGVSVNAELYDSKDIEASMKKIETISYHQEVEVNGIKFWCYNAGHVLGAAMFMIEIAGVRVLYTGDFSRQEDRHLMAAELPKFRPDVLVMESTNGTDLHQPQEERENHFTELVHNIVSRNGRCLIPVFALGKAQELLLILDEYWSAHPELQHVPIYYASSLAKKCMSVYQTYICAMNGRIQKQIAISNPFDFKFVSNLRSAEHFEDLGPSVVLASPGMLQSGFSRELLERWCTDQRNGVIIAGYYVEETLASKILKNPDSITTQNGQLLPLKCSVDYASFAAHVDYQQAKEFVEALRPVHVVLVHGEQKQMSKLKAALIRDFDGHSNFNVYSPRNGQYVEMLFRGEKLAKILGKMATKEFKNGDIVSGVVVKQKFNYFVMSPDDLPNYMDLPNRVLLQKLSVPYSGSFSQLEQIVNCLSGDVKILKQTSAGGRTPGAPRLKAFKDITLTLEEDMVVLEWQSSSANDSFADAIIAVILSSEPTALPSRVFVSTPLVKDAQSCFHDSVINSQSRFQDSVINSQSRFQDSVINLMVDMFGKESMLPVAEEGDGKIRMVVNSSHVTVDLMELRVTCENELLRRMVTTAVTTLRRCVYPVKSEK